MNLKNVLANSQKKYVSTEYYKDIQTAIGEQQTNKIIYSILEGTADVTDNALSNDYELYHEVGDNLNFDLYTYYIERGIDIYNRNHSAFSDSCYINKNFDYDVPQVYRKRFIFQGDVNLDNCQYQNISVSLGKVFFICKGKPTNAPLTINRNPIEKDGHADNLPTKCSKNVKKIGTNIGFWLYLMLFILFIAFNILIFVFAKRYIVKEMYDAYIKNDELSITEIIITFKDGKFCQNQLRATKSFSEMILGNFLRLHPLLSLCRNSVISPCVVTVNVFFLSLFSLFGFNAIYFNEKMIEDRIFDEHRNNFGYPMKTEFEKIMSSIVTTMCLTFIIKIICLITLEQKNILANGMDLAKAREGQDETVKNFFLKNLPRRIIAIAFITIIGVFFFFYTIVFCYIYSHAQYGWFYSGIWSLFMNWVVFSPFYIIVITLIQNSGMEQCAYYLKQLFVF